ETTSPVPHRDEDGNNLCDDCKVDLSTVVEVTSVTLDSHSATLTAGGATLTLRATVTPAGAATVVWTSSDKSVATVSDSGVVTPLKAGDVVITATAGGKSDTCSIKVNAATSVTPVDMTAEKWEQAFTFGDKVGFEQTYTCGDESGISAAKFDGDNCYILYRDRDFEQEAYIEVTEKKSYVYSRAYEYWTKTEIPGSNVGQSDAREILDTLIEMFPFDKFEKGTANGEYVAKEAYTVTVTSTPDEPQTFNITEAKINFSADGKIVSMEHVAVEEDLEEKMSTSFTYGVTLTMPEVLEGEKVTAEEWAAALAMTDTNYRLGLVTNGSRLDFEYSQNGTDKKFSGSEYFIGDNEPVEIYLANEGGM
ncbi:MAG: Ig-like domain-containing protein, partial [Clostridia bacterium]|nr:Ig-like domain-containing protein [Clostridia bacterium]